MSLNIALNTIIYIMVFLFPGILFRRAFFSGKFNNHFQSGSTFERFLWNLLFSLISIVLYSLFIKVVNYFTSNSLSHLLFLDAQIILNNLVLVYENKIPVFLKKPDSLIQIFYLLSSLYAFSMLLGYFLHRIIVIFGLEKRYSIFQFQNSWAYLTISNKQNNIHHKLGDVYYTKIDIKTTSDELFTGKLHEIVLDKEGKIEAYAIQEAYKFVRLNKINDEAKINDIIAQIDEGSDPFIAKHLETSTEFIYKSRIKGNLFSVFNDNIKNVSITYIKISHLYEKFQRYGRFGISLLMLLTIVFSISYAIWDYRLIDFTSVYKRIGFCIMLPLTLIFLILFVVELLRFNKTETKIYIIRMKDAFLILVYSFLPYLYIFNVIRFYILLLFLFAGMGALGFLLSNPERKIIDSK